MYSLEKNSTTLPTYRGCYFIGDASSGMFDHWGSNLALFLGGDLECELRRGDLGTKELPHCAEIKGKLKNCRKPGPRVSL